MDIKQLKYFITVADAGSFSKAALLLHISQPSLSNAIANLEKSIGSSLLERSTRHVRLTDTGMLLYERSIELINQFSIINEELQDVIHGNEIKIVFGMIEAAHRWFSEVMLLHHEQYPDIQFSIIDTLYNKSVMEALENYDIHAAISNHFIQGPHITCQQLYSEKFAVIMPTDHALAHQQQISLHHISNYPLITGMPTFETWKLITEAFEKAQITPKIAYEIERFEMVKMLVSSGAGISILPVNYVQNNLPTNLTYKLLTDGHLERPVYLCYLKNRNFPDSILNLFKKIEDFCK
ncbi:LysR family transcriptional regulator [Kurthia sibirica]|uniref:LysR family transcriptional regulator n=1 Tax=Kurthia sibirica TaxID=202750 RepID=A0A2U3APF7_9BACL|nr:LysR family transcriptional regulator [Kurthia sibirica]PWI26440.1 LysR family transcriptional regulator [Kurthia sibirica]GEK33006.1 LysR family transcriptional regulator [Kurthia sibirica]